MLSFSEESYLHIGKTSFSISKSAICLPIHPTHGLCILSVSQPRGISCCQHSGNGRAPGTFLFKPKHTVLISRKIPKSSKVIQEHCWIKLKLTEIFWVDPLFFPFAVFFFSFFFFSNFPDWGSQWAIHFGVLQRDYPILRNKTISKDLKNNKHTFPAFKAFASLNFSFLESLLIRTNAIFTISGSEQTITLRKIRQGEANDVNHIVCS